jgi:hypothetical protein
MAAEIPGIPIKSTNNNTLCFWKIIGLHQRTEKVVPVAQKLNIVDKRGHRLINIAA